MRENKYLRPGRDDYRLLQLLMADGSVFEGDSKDNVDEDLYREPTVEEDLDSEETHEKELLENTAEENLATKSKRDSDPEFDIPVFQSAL